MTRPVAFLIGVLFGAAAVIVLLIVEDISATFDLDVRAGDGR